MPKRKPPPKKRAWVRVVNGELRVNLTSGEVLTPVRDLSVADARQLVVGMPVFYFGYGIPVRELTGESAAIDLALTSSRDDVDGWEYNTFAFFRGDRGTAAVVIEHHH